MKLKLLSGILCVSAAALFCGGCGDAKTDNTIKIGVSIPAADHGWTGGIVWWAEQAKKEWEAKDPGVKVIISDHEFNFTPDEDEIIRRLMLEEQAGADILKIAVMAHSPEDALAVMSATAKMRHYHSARPMLTMAMGRAGVLTRITGEGFGSDMTFASVGGKASAPGQIPAEDCLRVLETLHKAMNP